MRRTATLLPAAVAAAAGLAFVSGAHAHAAPPAAKEAAPSKPVAAAKRKAPLLGARLAAAVWAGDYGGMQSLLKQGADPDARDPETGRTPLLAAALKRRALFARYLLAHGADADVRLLKGGRSALHIAVSAGDGGLVSALLAGGANPNAADDAGATPLQDAAAAGSERMVSLLLGAEPRVNARDEAGHTAAMLAVAAPPQTAGTVLGLLAKAKADLDAARPGDGLTALMLAARSGRADAVSSLLALGASPNKTARNGRTALSFARERGDAEIVRLLGAAAEARRLAASE